MTFIWPLLLLTLLSVPVFIGRYRRLLKRRQQAAAELGPLGILQTTGGRVLGNRRHVPPACYLLGLTLLLFSLARPEMTVSLPRTEGTVILAFDVSASMAADDLEPTRIDAAKTAARTFIEGQPQTVRIGIVAFSNGGLVIQQPTNDQAALLDSIGRLSPQGSTSLGQGIFTSLNAIAGELITIDEASLEEETGTIDIGKYPSAVVILLTDGENTGPPDPLDVAQVAAEASVRVYPIGIGSPEGAILETEGFNVLTQLDEAGLRQIASVTNGDYYQAEASETLQEIYENIDLRLTIEGAKMEVTAIFAGIGSLLFLIGGVLSMIWFGRMP